MVRMAYGTGSGGLQAFVTTIEEVASANSDDRQGRRRFISELGSQCAGIHGENALRHPFRFLREMQGSPPRQFGIEGFRDDFVDDTNPARHYTAFVVVGYWLPRPLAMLVLYAWEIASFVRYKGVWSQDDIRSGIIGIGHGRIVAREGKDVLAKLAQRDLGK